MLAGRPRMIGAPRPAVRRGSGQEGIDVAHHPDGTIARRDFARLLAGTLGAAALGSRRTQAAQPRVAPGIKLCVQSPAAPSDEQLLFLKQLGAEYVSVGAS